MDINIDDFLFQNFQKLEEKFKKQKKEANVEKKEVKMVIDNVIDDKIYNSIVTDNSHNVNTELI